MSVNLVEKAVELLCGRYVFPDKAQEAAAAIRKRLAAGEYDGLDEAALAERLTAELFEVSRDKHLRVRVRDESLREALTEPELEAAWREQQRYSNYGIARVERLDGNIGHLDLRTVTGAGIGGRAIAAAMELVSQTHGPGHADRRDHPGRRTSHRRLPDHADVRDHRAGRPFGQPGHQHELGRYRRRAGHGGTGRRGARRGIPGGAAARAGYVDRTGRPRRGSGRAGLTNPPPRGGLHQLDPAWRGLM
jgi:hypothetical protein